MGFYGQGEVLSPNAQKIEIQKKRLNLVTGLATLQSESTLVVGLDEHLELNPPSSITIIYEDEEGLVDILATRLSIIAKSNPKWTGIIVTNHEIDPGVDNVFVVHPGSLLSMADSVNKYIKGQEEDGNRVPLNQMADHDLSRFGQPVFGSRGGEGLYGLDLLYLFDPAEKNYICVWSAQIDDSEFKRRKSELFRLGYPTLIKFPEKNIDELVNVISAMASTKDQNEDPDQSAGDTEYFQ